MRQTSRLLSSKTIRATRKLAVQMVEMEPVPGDRPLRETRLKVYQKMLSEGMFRPCLWATARCKETETTYRVNGKHTSTMLASTTPFPDNFFVHFEEYECETLEDTARLYATFDSRLTVRTNSEINLNFAHTVPCLRDVGVNLLNVCASGMAYRFYPGMESSKCRPEDRAELLVEHSDFVRWFADLINSDGGRKENQHLIRQGVVACMFAGWQLDKDAARTFWKAVATGSGIRAEMPDRQIGKFLLRVTVSRDTKSETADGVRKKAVDNRQVYVQCIKAWNAWRRSDKYNCMYRMDHPVPEVV